MKLARAIHFDESDTRVFHNPARTGEWCVSGGFEFSNWGEGDLVGKARQAFANGWMGIETFGRVSFVAVAQVEPHEKDVLANLLAQHFVDIYGAPSLEAAKNVALEEPLLVNKLVSQEGTVTAVNVTIQIPHHDYTAGTPHVVDQARAIVRDFRQRYPDIKFYLTGMAVMNNAFGEAWWNDGDVKDWRCAFSAIGDA